MQKKPKHLAIKLKSKGEREIKLGHPWVFEDSIAKQNKKGVAGDVAILFDKRANKAFAIGLYDPYSPIRIKIISHQAPIKIDEAFFYQKIEKAYQLRQPLLAKDVNAYRLVFGENDGLPGFIVDVYNGVAVIKIYSAIWIPYLEILAQQIVKITQVEVEILRLSRQLQKLDIPYKEGDILYGKLTDSEILFTEYGVKFLTDVLKGHKTGFFLDHRENRYKIGQLSKGKSVLDVFSYAGGFSIHALAGGAKEVTSLDFSKQALKLATRNAELNPHSGKHKTIDGDAFKELRVLIKAGKQYDVVVIDPPSFAKSRDEIEIAQKKYAELTELGVALTKKGGLLFLASCSSRVKEEDFFNIHSQTFARLQVNYELLETTAHAIDHPVNFKEGAYLKSAYYRIH